MSDFCHISYYNMKILFFLILPVIFTCYSCNSGTNGREETVDSLAQLLNKQRDSIKKYPNEPGLKYNLAITYQYIGNYQKALDVLDSMGITKPDSTDPYLYYNYLFKRAELLELTGDTTNAIETLERFVMPGELTNAGIMLANLYAETKNQKVLAFADSMILNDAENVAPEPNYFKGIYYFNTGDYTRAIAEFDKSIQKDYNFMDAHLEKGISLYQLKKYPEALKVFDIALQVRNTFADAYYWKGKTQEAMGQKEEAKQNYQRAFSLDRTLTEAKEAAESL
jgi:tetratricopeptide (TPR) repeat protein